MIRTIDKVKPEEAGFSDYGHIKHFRIDKNESRRVLITGAHSYIGESFAQYVAKHYPKITCDTISLRDSGWEEKKLGVYDAVFHVAGIAHADVGKTSAEEQEAYYKVNTDLAIRTAKKAKKDGVKQFVYMSSMIIYGGQEYIKEDTLPKPESFYGNSKWLGDKGVREEASEGFKVAVIRAPMIYGRGSRGNYRTLAKLAKKVPVFPRVKNRRSMLYIENLCEFVAQLVLSGEGGVYFPQNREYSNTSALVKGIRRISGKNIHLSRIMAPAVAIGNAVPGKISGLTKKAFGYSYYDQSLSVYDGLDYALVSLKQSIVRTEGAESSISDGEGQRAVKAENVGGTDARKHILLISQYFHPETFRVNDMACEWVKRGYKVTVLTGIPNYPMGKYFPGYDTRHRTRETWNGVHIIRLPLIARGNSANKLLNAIGMAANYLSFIGSGYRWVKSKEAAALGADLVFTVEVSPMTQALIGVWYGKRYHVPSFLYVQDLWPENVETVTGIHSRFIIGPIDRMVDKIYRETGTIFTTSPAFVKAIVNRKHPVDKNKVHYLPQYAEDFYKPMEAQPVDGIDPEDGCYKIAFTGNIGTAQGLDVLPKAAALLRNEKVKFVIVGDGRYQPEFERQIKERNVEDKFIMIPRVPAERIPEILSVCDAGFISFNRTPLWENTIPAKLQSYMACGKAIIASASGETKRIIEEAGCGICCEIGNAKALADGIREILTQNSKEAGEKARMYFEAHFDKKKLMDEVDKYLSRAA